MPEKEKNPLWRWVVLHVVVIAALAGGLLALTRYKTDTHTDGVRQIYIVRHAEKLTGPEAGRNPDLSTEGKARAKTLAALLQNKHITHIYSSDTIRTRDTAAPLSDMTGIRVQIYDPRHLDALATRIKAEKGNSLIVGHSNTIRETVLALGGQVEDAPIDEASEYDRLYRVDLRKDGTVKTHLRRYGKRYAPH